MLLPYAQRFVRNAARLAERGFTTVEVLDRAYCPPLKRHVITYRPVPGRTLRDRLQDLPEKVPHHLALAASFIASLHEKGVYFRSLHFGNLIVPSEGEVLGLIDVADMTFRSRPLPVRLRVRNFSHLARRREDRETLEQFGWGRFVKSYLAAAGMPVASNRKFLENLPRLVPGLDLQADQ
jgi:tRNA A-37 threonylcarbamoyl transferase component Bud32